MKAFIKKILAFPMKLGIKPKMLILLIVVLMAGIWIGKSMEPESKTEKSVAEVILISSY